MRANNGSTMFITQTMGEAEALCDRIAIMVNGGLCCITETEKLKKLVGGYNLKIILLSHGDGQSYQMLAKDSAKDPAKLSAKKTASIKKENTKDKDIFDEESKLSERDRPNANSEIEVESTNPYVSQKSGPASKFLYSVT